MSCLPTSEPHLLKQLLHLLTLALDSSGLKHDQASDSAPVAKVCGQQSPQLPLSHVQEHISQHDSHKDAKKDGADTVGHLQPHSCFLRMP